MLLKTSKKQPESLIIHFARKYFGYFNDLKTFIKQHFRFRYNEPTKVGRGYRYDGVFEECPDELGGRVFTDEDKALVTSLLNTEGTWCSLNTWDDQLFTLGPGFSQTGLELNGLLRYLKYHGKRSNPNAKVSDIEQDLIDKAGVHIVDDGDRCYLALNGENSPCYNKIRNDKRYLSNIVGVMDSEKHRPEMIFTTMGELFAPESALGAVKKFRRKHWERNVRFVFPDATEQELETELLKMEIAAMHLAHWRPSSGFTNGHWSQFYQYCGSVAHIIILAYTIMDYQDAVSVKRKPRVQKFGDAMSCAGIIPYSQCVERMNNWYLGDEILDDLLSGSTERAEMVNHDESKPGYLYFQLGKGQNSYLRIQKYLVKSSEEFASNLKNNTNIIV